MLGVFDLLAGPTNVRALAPIDWPMPSIVLTRWRRHADCLARTGRSAAARAANSPRSTPPRLATSIATAYWLATLSMLADAAHLTGDAQTGPKPRGSACEPVTDLDDPRSRPRLPRCGRALGRACRRGLRPSPRCRGPARDRPREARSARFALDGRAIAARDSCAHERLSSNLSSSRAWARTAWLSRSHELAGDLAALSAAKPSLICSSGIDPAHQLVELELPGQVPLDVLRHVDAEPVRAHVRALEPLLQQELEPVDLDPLAERDHADHGRGAAFAEHVERLLRGRDEPDRLERVVDATAGELEHRADGVAGRRVDDIGRAERRARGRASTRCGRRR